MQGLIRAIVVAKSRADFAPAAWLLHLPRGFYTCRAAILTRLRVTLLGHHKLGAAIDIMVVVISYHS